VVAVRGPVQYLPARGCLELERGCAAQAAQPVTHAPKEQIVDGRGTANQGTQAASAADKDD
jgi:hypothetical protein